jgi:hypothetical protein
MVSMENAEGPTKIRPASVTACEKDAFSLKKPYPGWMASAPVFFAASMIFSALRYDCAESARTYANSLVGIAHKWHHSVGF